MRDFLKRVLILLNVLIVDYARKFAQQNQETVNHENKTSEEAEMEDVIAKDA